MAKQTMKSGLAGKLGKVTPHEVEVKAPGGGKLPPGIENGVAQLVDCRFGQYKEGKMQGEYFFIAAGVIVSPDTHDGVPIKGLRTQIMEPMCDTPDKGGDKARKTQQEHFDWVVNQLGLLLGKKPGDKFTIEPDDLEAIAEQIKEDKPYFRFRTFAFDKQVIAKKPNGKWGLFDEDAKGNKKPSRNIGEWATEEAAQAANPYAGREPMIFETWAGAVEYQADEQEADAQVEDNSADEPTPSEIEGREEVMQPDGDDIPYGDDLDDLVAVANEGGKKGQKAIETLGERAMAAGYSEAEVEGADNWEAVAEMIRNPKTVKGKKEKVAEEVDWAAVAVKCNSNDKKAIKQLNDATVAAGLNPDDFGSYEEQAEALSGGGPEAEAEESVPAAGEIWMHKPPKEKKPREFIVVSVNAKKRTVKLKDNDTKKDWPTDVSWDDIRA